MHSRRRYFIDQLRQKLAHAAALAQRAEADAREAARTVATESEKKEDGRVAIEFGSLATGQAARLQDLREALRTLDDFTSRGLPDFSPKSPVGLGAIVDVAAEDESGSFERTFIVLPVGAATELEGPGGDGFLTVITPSSPVGRALMGRRSGEVIDVTLRREPVEWEIVEVG